MAKPTKYATPICLGLTVIAALGIILGLTTRSALVTTLALLPTVGYEAYRTEGKSTRWAAWALLLVFIAQLVLLIFKINFDLIRFFGEQERYVAGYRIPLGDIKVAGSALMMALSVILFTRTRGIYTRWLAAIIFFTALAIVYILAPDTFGDLLKTVMEQSS